MQFSTLFKNTYIRNLYAVSFVLIVLGFVIAIVGLSEAEGVLIVHFTDLRGIDFLGSKGDVFSVLFSGIAIVLLNLFLTKSFFRRLPFFAQMISFFNLFVTILIFIAVSVIVSVN